MRLTTWNGQSGPTLARAALLAPLQSDILLLQECARPHSQSPQCLWFGDNPRKGVAVLAREPWSLHPGPIHSSVSDSAFPVIVDGPESFHLLAIWAKQRPTYVRALLHALDHYRDFLLAAPSVLAGDFNSHACFNKGNTINHTTLVQRLQSEFAVASAWHALHTHEPPTLYWQWKQDQPFHIDYCFLPQAWLPRLQSATIANYEDFAAESDHRPLTITLA